jgi:L-ascorbate metabolism protein UlaG (beta-lactamase superfamily)
MLRPDSIYTGERPDKESVIVLHHGDSFNDGIININAFDSTDTGNSYLLTINRKHIFHAGDLNAWVWKDESTKAEIDAAIRNFKKILETIKICTNTIDIAMFPVDSRIGKEYWEGASIFVQEFEVKHFFPMHFELGETDEQRNKLATDARRFQDYANDNSKGDYIALQSPYAVYRFSDL